jgi:hypothetical protein
MNELYNFILKIMNITNEYYEPELYYINIKYKLDSIKEFNKLYNNNLNQHKLLIFNSIEAEKLFIRLINLDENYIERKYNQNMKSIITNFINNKNDNYYFSICDEFYNINKSTVDNNNIFIHQIKSHVKNCNCKIKVKSVVNLSINTLIKIIKNTITNNKNSLINLKKKIKNSKSNLDLLDCIKILNTIKINMGIESVNNNYIIDDKISDNLNIFINHNNFENKNIKLKNYQYETEFPYNDIQNIDSLIQQKIKDFSFSVVSINDNNNQSKESNSKSSKSDIKSSKSDIKSSKSDIKSSKSNSKSSKSDSKSSKSDSKSSNSDSKSKVHHKDDLLFSLEKIIEYFIKIDINNFGECLSGFELIYNLKIIYKNNNLIVKSIDIILAKLYKNSSFDKEEFIKNINDLCKIIRKQ